MVTELYKQFPQSRGTYILILRLNASSVLTVGRLGKFPFASGWYAYVGSAFGAGGLRGRLKHHLAGQQEKRLHWHIDYLVQAGIIHEVWYMVGETALEHTWASILTALPHSTLAVARFGASDCKCQAHLFYFATQPSFDQFHAFTSGYSHVQHWDANPSG